MSTVAKKIMMGSGAVAGPFEIEQSLIYDHAGSGALVRTPSSASNRKTWTWSGWVKRSETSLVSNQHFFLFSADGNSDHSYMIFYADKLFIEDYDASVSRKWLLNTNRLFRDFGAWYHIVLAVDTTQGTASNRLKLYVNGVQETSFATATYPDQNYDGFVNTTLEHTVGNGFNNAANLNLGGYLAEVHFIDGTALAPSSFGETNEDTGQWIPKEYEGSYGTNGFYLKFASGAIGTDSSGQSNIFTASNLANSDVVTDSPTNNFATLNPLYTGSVSNTFSEGNLKIVTPSTGYGTSTATIVPTSGKYYAEFKGTTNGASGNYGVRDVSMSATNSTWLPDGSTKNMAYVYSGNIYYNGSNVLSSAPATFTTNDVIAVAIDYDNSTVKWYKNNSLQYTATSADLKNVTFAAGDSGNSAGVTAEINFGQKTFAYTPPSGYVALSTANLPEPAIALPSARFNTVLYNGTGSTPQTVTGVGFQPDFVWIKNRPTGGTNYVMYDAVRGTNKTMASSTANAESSDDAAGFSAFTSDGFTLRSLTTAQGTQNTLNQSHVSWNWKANGSGSTNTVGSLDSVVSANAAAGFSIATWTGNGSAQSIGHGLSKDLELIFVKNREASASWITQWVGNPLNDYMYLNDTRGQSTTTSFKLDITRSNDGTFHYGGSSIGQNGIDYLAYCFYSIPSFSKIGEYTGNANADGAFISTGFKPAWVMIKRTDATNNWIMFDNKRDVDNVATQYLLANEAQAEAALNPAVDFLSNGFKIRNTGNAMNANNGVYLYLAFAESPFRTSNAH